MAVWCFGKLKIYFSCLPCIRSRVGGFEARFLFSACILQQGFTSASSHALCTSLFRSTRTCESKAQPSPPALDDSWCSEVRTMN